MEENENYKIIKCPHCQKKVTYIVGTDYICPYCGNSLSDSPKKESRFQKVKQYVLNNKVLVAVTICLAICIFVMSGTVSSAVKDRNLLSDQLQEQSEQYENMQNDFEDLSEQYEELQTNYDSLQSEITNYQEQQETIDDLNSKLSELQGQYDTLSTENEQLKSQISELKDTSSSGEGTGGTGGWRIPGSSSGVSSSNSSNNVGSDMVWIPADGDKYHSIPNCGRMNPNTASQVSRSSAEAMGYDACSKCW